MDWTRSETIVLAARDCGQCHGLGLRLDKQGRFTACQCVYRSIFRACYARFRQCYEREKSLSRVSLDGSPRGGRKITWGRKNEEYQADFVLVSRRTLDANEWKLFNYHYLLGADRSLCMRKLQIDRGTFFHAIYRIQARLGRVFRELKPYSLYPLDEYFNGRTENQWTERPLDPVRPPAQAKRIAFSKRRWEVPLTLAA